MLISNYGELKAEVQSYLNRDDPEVIAAIPLMIELAERKIYRQVRVPENEKVMILTPPPGTAIKVLTKPADYAETKLLTLGTTKLDRITSQRYYTLDQYEGRPHSFTRVVTQFVLYPSSNAVDEAVTLYYWADFTGQLVNDDDTNPILDIMPDLYLYGALLESMPFIKNDERMPVWQAMYTGTLDLISGEQFADEHSGSNNVVTSAYGD